MEKTVAICTLGCKTNQYESNAIIQEFIKNNYKVVEFSEKADVYIVNTCTVTNIADRKSRQILRRAKHKNKTAILVAVGCYAQMAREKLKNIEEIDIILGNNEKKDVIKHVENFRKKREEEVGNIADTKEYLEFGNITYTEKTRAVIKIQDGCNNFCTYCIIPYSRGRIRSRKLENIISEITQITKLGIKEVVLTGIQIAAYGKDLEENIELIDLLEEINKIKGLERIRIRIIRTKTFNRKFYKKAEKTRQNM